MADRPDSSSPKVVHVLTREEFAQFEKRAEEQWKHSDRRFDEMAQLIKDEAEHHHREYVGWGALTGLLTALAAVGLTIMGLLG